MTSVMLVCRDEPLGLDPERLAALYVELGEAHAQVAVARAMEDLLAHVDQLRTDLAFRGSASRLARTVGRIHDIAEPLGLSSLSLAAQNAEDAVQGGDIVSTFATLARLERVANRSIKMVWDIQELSS